MDKVQFIIVILGLAVIPGILTTAGADGIPFALSDGDDWLQSDRAAVAGKADADSIYLLGGPDRFDGRFEDEAGQPDWQGWTHEDATNHECYWQVSDFRAVFGQYSAWCGTYFGEDPGYGDRWNERLVFRYQVPDPGVASTVRWTALMRVDTEPEFDVVHFAVNQAGEWIDLLTADGERLVPVDVTVTLGPDDYVGPSGDEIQLRIQVTSDGNWSDEDGRFDTDGACQVDDMAVTVNGSIVSSENFEDGELGDWVCETSVVGDFTALYAYLLDLDPCRDNNSVQVAFIDDGVVVPGTGGSSCTTWCYGPNGYIVNNTGGLAGPGFYIDNRIMSPVMEMPAGMDGLELRAGVYRHEEFGNPSTWPGIGYGFYVRSTSDPAAAPISSRPWRTNGFYYYTGPEYVRGHWDVSNYLEPGSVEVQVSMFVREFGYFFGHDGTDGTPAPYFDNIACVVFPHTGPIVRILDSSMAGDAFPASGDLDLANLAGNAVRFDAMNTHIDEDGGPLLFHDNLVFVAEPVRTGSVLDGPPVMHVRMQANPLFDQVRELPPGFLQEGAIIMGQVLCDTFYSTEDPPAPVPGRFQCDLPDSGFFFPGDVIHYFFEAHDNLFGDIGKATSPSDTSGFSDFGPFSAYPANATVYALPTMRSQTAGDQPPVLIWVEELLSGRPEIWQHTLAHLGWERGVEYDWFYSKRANGAYESGLGGVATSAVLGGYDTLVYDGGALASFTLSLRDLAVLENWFDRGDKHALITGDGLVTDLSSSGSQALAFLNSYLSVEYIADNLTPFVESQLSPRVAPVPDNGFVARVDEWVVRGGCPTIATMDAVAPVGNASGIARFLDPGGNPAFYQPLAAVYHHDPATSAEVVMMPYTITRIVNAPGWVPPAGYEGIAARAIILEDILAAFGEYHPGQPIGVPETGHLAVRSSPNPFNPRTTIALNVPRGGAVTVKIFSIRGELVRTLLAERLDAGAHELLWDGTTDGGRPLGSGVYFCEVRAVGEVQVTKLSLIR